MKGKKTIAHLGRLIRERDGTASEPLTDRMQELVKLIEEQSVQIQPAPIDLASTKQEKISS